MAEQHAAIRTCIGCRERGTRGELRRYVHVHDPLDSRRVVADHERRLPGRGAWLHDDERCRNLAIKRRAFRRALRIAGDVEVHIDDLHGVEASDGAGHVTSPR